MGRVLGTFLIIVVVIMIINAVSGTISATYMALHEFFLNSIWGILAFIFLGLAGFFFYASSKTYPQVREKGRVIDTLKPIFKSLDTSFSNSNTTTMNKLTKSNTDVSVYGNSETEIDLSSLDLRGMTRQLASVINKPNAIFFKGWANDRLRLDVERVHIIKDYIDAIQAAGESFINLKADAIFSYEKIQGLVQIKRNELLKQLRESALEIDFVEEEYKAKVDRLHIDTKMLQARLARELAEVELIKIEAKKNLSDIENVKKQVEADIKIRVEQADSDIRIREEESKARIILDREKAEAEVYVMKLKARDTSKISRKRAKALDMIIKEMKANNLKPIQVYLLIKLLETTDTGEFIDFDNKMNQMNEQLERMKIENNKLGAEAREANARADEVEKQSQKNIKDLYT